LCAPPTPQGVENKEHAMNTTTNRRHSVTATLGLAVAGAAASVLLSLGTGIAHAGEFDPQPDPPGQSRGFDPQPEPPSRHFDKFSPSQTLNPPPGLKTMNLGH
jgi:hypothetical protein